MHIGWKCLLHGIFSDFFLAFQPLAFGPYAVVLILLVCGLGSAVQHPEGIAVFPLGIPVHEVCHTFAAARKVMLHRQIYGTIMEMNTVHTMAETAALGSLRSRHLARRFAVLQYPTVGIHHSCCCLLCTPCFGVWHTGKF